VSAETQANLSARSVWREVVAAYRAHWLFLIAAAVLVLLPQSLADGFLDHLELEGVHSARDVAILAAAPLTVVVNLFGQAFYAGLTAAAVIEWRAHRPLPNMRALLRSVPLGRLVLLDLVLTLGTAIGLLLVVIPGLLWLAYFSLAPAMVKFEHRDVWSSLRRSRELVRGNFWRVLVIVVGTIVLTETLVAATSAPFHGAGLITLVNLGADGLLQPIEGLVIVVVALELMELRGELPQQEELSRAVGDELRPAAP
jgi:Uncharacterised protein family (UPF0259)